MPTMPNESIPLEKQKRTELMWILGAAFSGLMSANTFYNFFPLALGSIGIPVLGTVMGGISSLMAAVAIGLSGLVGGPIIAIFLIALLPQICKRIFRLFFNEENKEFLQTLRGGLKATVITVGIAGIVFVATFFVFAPLLLPAVTAFIMAASIIASVVALAAAAVYHRKDLIDMWSSLTDNGAWMRTAEVTIGLGAIVVGAIALTAATALVVNPFVAFAFIAVGLTGMSGFFSDSAVLFQPKETEQTKPEGIEMQKMQNMPSSLKVPSNNFGHSPSPTSQTNVSPTPPPQTQTPGQPDLPVPLPHKQS